MNTPYLGKIKLYWCDECHVPLIANICGICDTKGRKINLTPPGDFRPAFDGDIKNILIAINGQFGDEAKEKFQTIIRNQIFLLNKIPYIDRMEEIIVQGEVVGIFRFNVVRQQFEVLPKISLAVALWSPNSKGWIEIDEGARIPIIKGASVLSPGVKKTDPTISIDQPVIVVCKNEVIAVGLAKMLGYNMGVEKKGIAVKTKYRLKTTISSIPQFISSWEQIIEANSLSMKNLENEAIDFIEAAGKNYKSHVVAYSGGKDSLVTLDLVSKSDIEYNIIFSDTGLEYPETIDNIRKIGYFYNRKIHSNKNEGWDFWSRFNQFGPPSRNSRWCCKSAKLNPINEILDELYPREKFVLSYIGRRRYESYGRSKESRVSKNPWIPKQITAAPISDWNAFEVYLYIKKHALTDLLNPLYNIGFVRIGCWLCPASSLSDFRIMQNSHPDYLNKLMEKILKIQSKFNLPSEYSKWGLWRWKYLPQKVINLLNTNNIKYNSIHYTDVNSFDLKFSTTSTPSPCINGGYSSFLSANQILDLNRLINLVPILGSIQYDEELDILSILTKSKFQSDIFRDGSIIIRNKNLKDIGTDTINIVKTIYRITNCDGCGICTHQCPKNALKINSGVIQVNQNQCTHCLKCNNFCPLINYRDEISFFINPS
ncbi:MAG: hypothetical protein EAX86_08725 [Candidatus Heimdallarchaeota archaeon]|nr:hypothetical protein [Candidatus Heimdallarchaeota archaeon]